MPKTIAEMRASQSVGLPERPVPICFAQKIVAQVQSLNAEHDALMEKFALEEAKAKRPIRAGEGRPARVEEILDELEVLFEEMREHTGTLTLRGISGGAWRRWVADHPVRQIGLTDQGAPIWNPVDEELAYGYCNADALFDDLRTYAKAWNGDPVNDSDWEFILEFAAPGDLNEAVKTVVQMHEFVGAKAPLSRRPSSTTTRDESASSSQPN